MSQELIPRKVDPNGRIVLPPDVQKALRIKPGDYVGYEIQPDMVVLHKVSITKV